MSYSCNKTLQHLVDELLWDIYGKVSVRQKEEYEHLNLERSYLYTDDGFLHICPDSWKYPVRVLEEQTIESLTQISASLRLEVRIIGYYLTRVLMKRDRKRRRQDMLCDVITACLQAFSDKSAEAKDMKFRLSPPSPPKIDAAKNIAAASSDFNQWLHAMKMVARLPGGMPPEFRKKLWLSLSDRYLQTKNVDWDKEQAKCFSEQWREDDEELGIQIVKDLHRTGSSLCSGPAGSLNQAKLKRVLLGYARWNPEVGYCQGFNMLGALILQVMDKNEEDSMKVMIFLVEGLLPSGYFSGSLGGLQADMAVFRELMTSKLPRLAKHLQKLQGPMGEGSFEPPLTNVFTMQWFLTLFCTCLPISCVLRVWDLILIEGSDVLLRTALAIWSLLEEKILATKTADDFYCRMGSLSGELLNGHLIDSNGLIEKVVELGPISELQKLREKHLYNIAPWQDKKGLKIFYSDDEADSDEDSRLAVATVWGLRLNRRGSSTTSNKPVPDNKDRIALDISLLKKQYDRLRERQRQAHIILTSAVAKQGPSVTNPPPPLQMNQLLMGRNAILTNKGRRIGPPPGAIPPARKVSNATNKPVRQSLVKPAKRGETLHWHDTEAAKRRKSSITIKPSGPSEPTSNPGREAPKNHSDAPSSSTSSTSDKAPSVPTARTRKKSESSSYSEDSDANSSTSTSLCDDDDNDVGISSLEASPLRKLETQSTTSRRTLQEKENDIVNKVPDLVLTRLDKETKNAKEASEQRANVPGNEINDDYTKSPKVADAVDEDSSAECDRFASNKSMVLNENNSSIISETELNTINKIPITSVSPKPNYELTSIKSAEEQQMQIKSPTDVASTCQLPSLNNLQLIDDSYSCSTPPESPKVKFDLSSYLSKTNDNTSSYQSPSKSPKVEFDLSSYLNSKENENFTGGNSSGTSPPKTNHTMCDLSRNLSNKVTERSSFDLNPQVSLNTKFDSSTYLSSKENEGLTSDNKSRSSSPKTSKTNFDSVNNLSNEAKDVEDSLHLTPKTSSPTAKFDLSSYLSSRSNVEVTSDIISQRNPTKPHKASLDSSSNLFSKEDMFDSSSHHLNSKESDDFASNDNPRLSPPKSPKGSFSLSSNATIKAKNEASSHPTAPKSPTAKFDLSSYLSSKANEETTFNDTDDSYDASEEGVTNEYFERVNIVERPKNLSLYYSHGDRNPNQPKFNSPHVEVNNSTRVSHDSVLVSGEDQKKSRSHEEVIGNLEKIPSHTSLEVASANHSKQSLSGQASPKPSSPSSNSISNHVVTNPSHIHVDREKSFSFDDTSTVEREEPRSSSCPEPRSDTAEGKSRSDHVLRIIEENSKILNRILKKHTSDDREMEQEKTVDNVRKPDEDFSKNSEQTKHNNETRMTTHSEDNSTERADKEVESLTSNRISFSNKFVDNKSDLEELSKPKFDSPYRKSYYLTRIERNRASSRPRSRTENPLRYDDNIADRLESIKKSIKSIDTLCDDRGSCKSIKCQKYIDSLFETKDKTKPTPFIKISEPISDYNFNDEYSYSGRSTSSARYSRDLRRDTSPRRKQDEEREEYESRVRRDNLPIDSNSFSEKEGISIEHTIRNNNRSPSRWDNQTSVSLKDNTATTTNSTYIPNKIEIRHTTVTATMYDRYLYQKKERDAKEERSPPSPVITKSYLDSLRPNALPIGNRSARSAENSPSKEKGYSIKPTTSPFATSPIEFKEDLQIRSCDNILMRLGNTSALTTTTTLQPYSSLSPKAYPTSLITIKPYRGPLDQPNTKT